MRLAIRMCFPLSPLTGRSFRMPQVWKRSYCSWRPLPRFLVSTLQMGSFLLSSVSLSQEWSPQTTSLWFSWECLIKSRTSQFQHRLLSYNLCRKCQDKLAAWMSFHQLTQLRVTFIVKKDFGSLSVFLYVCVYVCTCVFLYMYVYVYVCVYISVCVYM